MKSLQLRIALWYALSVVGVVAVFISVTFWHLRRELHDERWERETAGGAGWLLHGSYAESEVADIVGELWTLSLIYAAPVILLALLSGRLVARQALAPVSRMGAHLQRIGVRNLDQRIDTTTVPRELREIGESVNDLLERLESSFRQLSEFSAQVAHELRTPLTLVRLQIEESAGQIEPALAESIQDELKRLSDYVEQCLLLATAEQGRLRLQSARLPLGEIVSDVVEAYSLLAREEHRAIRLATTECPVVTDPRHLRQLLHLLLSNALRHGEGGILVTVRTDAQGASCRILNPVRPNLTAGNGIGLRLASALASALSLSLETGFTPEGHYAATLRFPPSTPSPASEPAAPS